MKYAESYDVAMLIADDQELANKLFDAMVRTTLDAKRDDAVAFSRDQAEKLVRDNLGYYAGYYDDATRERVERLFKCQHPYFGPIKDGKPTPEECFRLGVELGEKWAREGRER